MSEPPSEKKMDLEQALAQMLTSHTALFSNSEVNPRREGNEHVKAATLRNGREFVIPG